MTMMKLVRPSSESEKHTRSTVDTIEITAKLVASWKVPPFQRELKVNAKVEAVARLIAEDRGVLPGIVTLGVLDKEVYIVDGQHRLHAFLISGEDIGYVDVRTVFFKDMAEMADEFETLNSQLVIMRPDDKLRALEHSTEAIRRVRKKCPFIGYDNIRRDSKNAPVLSMSTFIRAWTGCRGEIPRMGLPAKEAVKAMDASDTDNAIDFAMLAFEAWRRDREFFRMWSGLNLVITMWLYRRMVLAEGMTAASRWTRLSRDEFRRGLMALSAEQSYLEYLFGRNVNDRDRTPTYSRAVQIMTKRYRAEGKSDIRFPRPAWAHA
jgi:hypothetical protein